MSNKSNSSQTLNRTDCKSEKITFHRYMSSLKMKPCVQLLLVVSLILLTNSQTPSTSKYIVVYVQPPSNSLIYASCWSNSTNPQVNYSKNFTSNGEFAWEIDPNSYYSWPYVAFWCRATMGNSILTKFPIYGDRLPRNSSEWLINSVGKRRISWDDEPTNDYKALWTSY